MSFFAQQLAMYAGYHRDPRNRATHFIGIPAIVFSLLVACALWRFRTFGLDTSAAWVCAAIALGGWIALDVTIGLAMALVVIPFLIIAEWIARSFGTSTVWIVFGVFFVGGWVFQFIGHAWEGRRPALTDNLFQAFIGPMFIMAEILMMLGLKQDLKRIVDATPSSIH